MSMTTNNEIPRDLLGKIIDEVFDGAIEDASVIEDIYRVIARECQPAMPADADLLYWDVDDTEDCLARGCEYDAVLNAVENAWKPELPFEFTVNRAMCLPDVRITVTAIPEDGEIVYEREEIQPARRRIEGE